MGKEDSIKPTKFADFALKLIKTAFYHQGCSYRGSLV
jgi:hypothetical protein